MAITNHAVEPHLINGAYSFCATIVNFCSNQTFKLMRNQSIISSQIKQNNNYIIIINLPRKTDLKKIKT